MTLHVEPLDQEDYDSIIMDARVGDLESLKNIFTNIIHPSLLLMCKDKQSESTPLHMAAANGHLDVVKYLLSLVEKDKITQWTNTQNETGNTCLHWASLNGHLNIVKLLCEEYNADPFIKNKFGHDSIFEAENNGREDVETYYLQKYNIEPKLEENNGTDTPILDIKIKEGTEIENITKEATEVLREEAEKLNICRKYEGLVTHLWIKDHILQSNIVMSELAVELGLDPSLKKKKKTKKITPEDFGDSIASGSVNDDDLFAGLKKKKKKSKESEDGQIMVDEVSEALGELKLKKKKKKTKELSTVDDFEKELAEAGVSISAVNKESASSNSEEFPIQKDVGFSYHDLLSRFFTILTTNNPELAGDRSGPKFRIPPPICQRDGKKTIFANIQEISEKLQRSTEHLIQYLFAEFGTSGSVDGQKRLVIKGKFQPKQMENVLRRYILEYVTCKTCKSINTDLKKEQSNRLLFLVCKSCGSTRSVSSIKTGFQATVGKRKKM